MSPEEYDVHRECVLWLSEHPLIDRSRTPDRWDLEPDRETRQATLEEVAR